MATRLSRVAALLVIATAFLASGSAFTAEVPPPAYRIAAFHENVPASALFAVALQESGMSVRGRLRPWPWTLNVAGTPYRYATGEQACSGLRQALRTTPAVRIDVGLGQVNLGYHGHRVQDTCQLLNPYRNLQIAAAILREQHIPGDDWFVAIGRYHRPAGGEPAERYRQNVKRHYKCTFGSTTVADVQGETPR